MFYVLISIVVLIFILDALIHNSRNGRLYDKIPGPKLYPLIGNCAGFLLPAKQLFYKGRWLANGFGPIVKIWAGPQRVLNLYDPDDIEILLSSMKYMEKSIWYNFLHSWMKTGLLTSNGEKWQKRRKLLTPTFHFNILRQFCMVFAEQSLKLVDELRSEVGKETVILPYITDFALKTICETAMGINLDSQDQTTVIKYKKATYDLGQILLYRFTRMWFHPDITFNLTPMKRKETEAVEILHNFTQSVINERRKLRGNRDDFENEDNGIGTKKRLAMLDLLLSAEDKGEIDDAGIREEVDTFTFEGHDTTTMAIIFALMLLANHPDSQDKIITELDEIMGVSQTSFTIDNLNKMNYLERCIKEALRLYPSVPFLSRTITEEMQLKNYTVPANTICNVHPYDLHRKAELFPNPDKFDPDRFLPENCLNRHPYAYIPFSAGPRNCIGQKFAILEEKTVIATILRNYKLLPVTRPDDIRFFSDIILRSHVPIKIKFIRRD